MFYRLQPTSKHLTWALCNFGLRLKVVKFRCKTLHLRCLWKSWIHFIVRRLDQENFPQPEVFPWSRKFSTSRDFSINKEIFHDQGSFSQAKILPQLRKFSTSKDFFLIMEEFFTIKDFSTIKKCLNIFEKHFIPLIIDGNKRSFVFTEGRSLYL